MPQHPDRETLRGFIAGELSSQEARQTDQHLSICSDCRDRADEVATQLTLRLLDSWLQPGYDEAFERAADRTAEQLAGLMEESRRTDNLLAELLQEPASRRRRRITDDEKLHSLKLCQILQSRSRGAWTSDPATALEMADLAVEVAQYLDSGRYGSGVVEDIRALAWAYLGNAFRIASDLWRSEQALRQAWSHHLLAGGDAYTEAEIFSFNSSLRNDQNRNDEAVQLSDRAIAIYREVQDRHLEGAALLLKGKILGYGGRTREAIPVLRAGLNRIDWEKDPRLVWVGKHNLTFFIAQGGAPGKAQQLIEQNRPLYQGLGTIDWARVHWLEGKIARYLGQFTEAEAVLHEVLGFFLDCHLGIEVFQVSLDIAKVYTLSGRNGQVKKALADLIPLGEALGLRKEVLLARLLYENASRS